MKNFVRKCSLRLAKYRRASRQTVPSIVSAGAKIKGDILNADVIQIDGQLEGNVSCRELIIGTHGLINGKVQAKNLSVYGSLQGQAQAEQVFLAASAHLSGDVCHQSLSVEPGAFIEGKCIHYAKPQNATPAAAPMRVIEGFTQKRS